MSNSLLIIITLLAGLGVVGFLYFLAKNEQADADTIRKFTIDKLLEIVKNSLSDLVKSDDNVDMDSEDFESSLNRKARVVGALRDCAYGVDHAKEIVKHLINNIIRKALPTIEEVLEVKNFMSDNLDPAIKFEIMLYFYKKEYQKDALENIIVEHDWIRVRRGANGKIQPYHVNAEDVDEAYAKLKYEVTYDVMIEVLTVLIFQKYKGFGIIDTVREMNIDGINIGVSGSVLTHLQKKNKKVLQAPRSVWVQFKAIYIHLRFLSFGTEDEIKRVVQSLIRWEKPGPLTEKRGFIVSHMYDKSRIECMRPGAGEYWAAFIRKFTLKDQDLRSLFFKPYLKNAELPYELVKWSMLGELTTAFTGRQSSGKTTAMRAAVEFIDSRYNIRVLETTSELYLREMYDDRNIFCVQQTLYNTMEELQDAIKKTDAAVSMVGEVASNQVAVNMLQFATIASIFTIFSSHHNTTEDLITGIRDSVVMVGGNTSTYAAERKVIEVIKADIHFDFNTGGERFVKRYTIVIPLSDSEPYPEIDKDNLEYSMAIIDREHKRRLTDRRSFDTRVIMEYNETTKTYEAKEWFTPEMTKHILGRLTPEDKVDFIAFYNKYWGEGVAA